MCSGCSVNIHKMEKCIVPEAVCKEECSLCTGLSKPCPVKAPFTGHHATLGFLTRRNMVSVLRSLNVIKVPESVRKRMIM